MICDRYKYKYLTARFHYVSIDNFTDQTFVPEYSKQVEKLKTMIENITTKYPQIEEITIIGHSQGCFIPALYLKETGLTIKKLILLSPPATTDVARKMVEYFRRRKGTVIDMKGTSILKRSNGSETIVPKEFWLQAEKTNPLEAYKYVNSRYDVVFVRPMGDQVVTAKDYENLNSIGKIKLHELPGDHDYKEDNREGILGLLDQLL
jgi:hypothetical protein